MTSITTRSTPVRSGGFPSPAHPAIPRLRFADSRLENRSFRRTVRDCMTNRTAVGPSFVGEWSTAEVESQRAARPGIGRSPIVAARPASRSRALQRAMGGIVAVELIGNWTATVVPLPATESREISPWS